METCMRRRETAKTKLKQPQSELGALFRLRACEQAIPWVSAPARDAEIRAPVIAVTWLL
jgi:hypothetical protein